MILRCLGGLRVDGATFARRKPTLLLAYLAIEGRQSRERLARLFWPDARDPRNRLSVALHRIRTALPDALAADHEFVAARVATDVEAMREALAHGELERALRLYAGRFLEGVSVAGVSRELEAWTVETGERLAGALRDAMLSAAVRAVAERRVGAAGRLVQDAVTLPGAPEPAVEALERAHALALASGAEVAERLRRDGEELGLDLASSVAEARARLIAEAPPSNLPRRTTSFVGRSRERVELGARLGDPDRPVITLLGPGGMGKTRLALALARDQLAARTFPGGVFFVPLAAIRDPGEVPAAIAEAIGARPRPGDTPLDAVLRALGARRTLLVLDDAGGLADAATTVADLIDACPETYALVTSRERLEIEAESVFPLEGLAVPAPDDAPAAAADVESVQLFIDRARRARLDFVANDADVAAIASLCRTLGGAPLAIELAAVRARDATPRRIAEEVARSLDALATPSRTIPDRHRTLRASFDVSWNALDADERRGLAWLAAFRGGFDAEAARAVAGVSESTLDRLVARSLVADGDGARFDLHPVVAAYAQEKLDGAPDGVRARLAERHARHYAAVVAAQNARYHGPHQAEAALRLEQEHANVAEAGTWAREHAPELALRMAGDLRHYWRYAGRFAEGFEAAVHALAAAGDASAEARIAARVAAGSMAYRLGDLGAARAHLRTALARAEALGVEGADAGAWQALGDVAYAERALDEAETCFGAAMRSARARRDDVAEAAAGTAEGRLAARRRDFAAAGARFERARVLSEGRGDAAGAASANFNLASVARDTGDLSEAEDGYGRALAFDTDVGDRWGIAACLHELAGVAYLRGEHVVAARRFREARRICRAIGDAPGAAGAEHGLGLVAFKEGRLGLAARHQSAALRLWLDLAQDVRTGPVLWALARIADAAGRFDLAARLWGAEAAVMERFGQRHAGSVRDAHARDVAETRERMAHDAFERAFAAGRRWTPAEVASLEPIVGDDASVADARSVND